MKLLASQSLYKVARYEVRPDRLRQKFLNAYGELENAYEQNTFLLSDVVDSAFAEIDFLNYPIARHFRDVASSIANRVDRGEDNSLDNAHHNPLHFAKVVTNFTGLSINYNAQVRNNLIPYVPMLDDRMLAAGIYACTIHDLGYKLTGNMSHGGYRPAYNENHSIELAGLWNVPRPKTITPADKGLIIAAHQTVLGTDVAGLLFGLPSYSQMIRTAYDDFIGRRAAPIELENRPIKKVLRSPFYTAMAALVGDADMLCSTISAEQYNKETVRFVAETRIEQTPVEQLKFFQRILGGRMTTHPARALADGFIQSKIAECRAKLGLRPA